MIDWPDETSFVRRFDRPIDRSAATPSEHLVQFLRESLRESRGLCQSAVCSELFVFL
jgi:hypothetical protein